MSAKIAVEIGADVPQFMENSDELLVERTVQEPRQVETEDIEVVAPRLVECTLDGVAATVPSALEAATFESHRSQSRLQTVADAFTGPAKGNGDLIQLNMGQFGRGPHHVVAESANVGGKIES